MLVFVEEWGHSNEHFVDQDAESPPVNSHVVAILIKHLWRKVFGCAAETVGLSLFLVQHLCQPVVNDFDITLLVHKNVFQLEISVHKTKTVEVPDC